MGFSRVSGRYKSSWTRPYNECYEHKDTLYRQTMWFTNTILRRIACFRHTKKMACSQIAIIYSFFSSFWSVCKTFFRRKSTNILARSLRSLDIIFLKFLVSNEQDHITSVTNTVMDILYRQTVINQQCISWDLRRIVCFQRRYKKIGSLAFARSQSCIHFLQFPTRRHSIRPYHEHIKWINTRTYCTDKNMLLTNLTINRTFSTQNTKISARSLAISYICFQVRIVKKKKRGGKPYYQLLRKIWWLPHPRLPTRALYAKLQREKLHFLSLLTTILKALICWKLESFRGLRPWAPGRGFAPAPRQGP